MEYGVAIGVSMALAIFIRFFLVEAYQIPSSVMRPGLLPGDYIFASKISYGVKIPFSREYLIEGSSPKYGDVVVYEGGGEKDNLIKRVVGLPGDTIQIRDGRLIFNGQTLKFDPGKTPSCGSEAHPKGAYNVCYEPPFPPNVGPITVPARSVYVLADYRTQAARRKGGDVVPLSAIKGKAVLVWLSVKPKSEGDQMSLIPSFRLDRFFSWVN